MQIIQISLWGIIVLSYLLPWAFIKSRWKKAVIKELKEGEKFRNIENFIKIKEFQFEKSNSLFIFIIGISITLFIGVKITNLGGIYSQIILAIGLIGSLSTFVNLRKPQEKIIEELYKIKDSKK